QVVRTALEGGQDEQREEHDQDGPEASGEPGEGNDGMEGAAGLGDLAVGHLQGLEKERGRTVPSCPRSVQRRWGGGGGRESDRLSPQGDTGGGSMTRLINVGP